MPIVVGESICGILQLANRRSGGPYTPRDKELLRIFAAYMSSSIQNALDAIRARAQARIDDLTGLANSRYFHTRLEEEIARADRDGTELSMLFIDLDRFKEVNDRFGHLAGSWTLQKVAQAAGRQRARRPRWSPATAATSSSSSCRAPTSTRAAQTAETLRLAIADAVLLRPHADQRAPHADAAAAHHGVARRRVVPRPPGARAARSAAARARSCAWPTRPCTAPRPRGRNRVEVAEPEE